MNLDQLLVYFESSSAVRLLRAQHAPFVIRFLFEQFKQSDSLTVAHSDLVSALRFYQEEVHERFPDVLRDRPESYLTDWCSRERMWLHRTLDADHSEPVYQLTSGTEQVLEFLGRTMGDQAAFIGTESRLRLVIDTLEKLAIGASQDPAVHLDYLRAERARITAEIRQIERNGSVTALAPTRIREQFALAVSLLKELQHDFRAVEERFRQITQDVQQQQVAGEDTRGGILSHALDAEDALRSDDQGISFYEFFRFIQSPEQQNRLRAIIARLTCVQEIAQQTDNVDALRRMMPSLLAEAGKVTETERRLSAALRRLLDEKTHRERQQVAEVLLELRGLFAERAADPPRELVQLEIDDVSGLSSPFARTFWTQPPQFEQLDLTDGAAAAGQQSAAFEDFARMHRLDFHAMRSRIRDAVSGRGSITLKSLLTDQPVEGGVMDLLGYLQIAADDGHNIRHDAEEDIVLPAHGNVAQPMIVTVPLVTFIEQDEA